MRDVFPNGVSVYIWYCNENSFVLFAQSWKADFPVLQLKILVYILKFISSVNKLPSSLPSVKGGLFVGLFYFDIYI